MPKPRTKRTLVREERKRKRKHAETDHPPSASSKRPRIRHDDEEEELLLLPSLAAAAAADNSETEYFGMLNDEEQERFRRADEMLERNDFASPQARAEFVDNVFDDARGKETKLASSQSCSRLTERLIQLSTTAHKKRLFDAFAGHFPSLVRHRFASHCCEALFLCSAGVVTDELAAGFEGFVVDVGGQSVDEQVPEASMESLFLATLDELEAGLSSLLTDRFASHTLRVLLLVLSGRPLDDAASKTLVKSRKKEHVSIADAQMQGSRAVPASFTAAVAKIIADTTVTLDAAGLRVLARHPIGNPMLQLLLDLDLARDKTADSKSDDTKEDENQPSLLQRLLPGAPQSLADETSQASELINGLVYDQIGSRLVEILVARCPGKIFRALNQHIFLPRIHGYVRNDISCYPAIKVLNRLSRDDLVAAVAKILPTVPQLVSKARYNVLRTLFERCAVRDAPDEIKQLIRGLREGCGTQPADLVTTLCALGNAEEESKPNNAKDAQPASSSSSSSSRNNNNNSYAIQSHGAHLLTSLLALPGPAKGVQEALLALLPSALALRLATTSTPTATLLATALHTPSTNALFQKTTVTKLVIPHVAELATSPYGHRLVVAVAALPSKGSKDLCVPAHVKEVLMDGLAGCEARLRESWRGRGVWRAWRGDKWRTRKGEWKAWIKESTPTHVAGVDYTGVTEEVRDKKKSYKKDTKSVEAEDGVRSGVTTTIKPEVPPNEEANTNTNTNSKSSTKDGKKSRKKKKKSSTKNQDEDGTGTTHDAEEHIQHDESADKKRHRDKKVKGHKDRDRDKR